MSLNVNKRFVACLVESERLASMHLRMRENLMSQVHASIAQWKMDHYHKSFFSWKETKTAEDGFEKSQRPWTKRLVKVEKYKKLYHQSGKSTETVMMVCVTVCVCVHVGVCMHKS